MNDGVDGLLDQLLDRAAIARSRAVDPGAARRYLEQMVEPFPRRGAPHAELIERVQCDRYRQDRVELEVFDGVRFCAYVLVPEPMTGRAPGVIATHGHGYGSRQVAGMAPDGSPAPDAPGDPQHFAVQLARRGLIVVAPDVVGFGERMTDRDRRFDPEAGSACYRLSTRLLMHGLTLAGLRVAELLGVLDYLVAREDVDPDRIGIMGHSGGSTLSLIAAAVDDRIGATVLSAYPNTFAASIGTVRHCACNYLPGILEVAEQPDLLALLAPRPLFVESGRDDPIFPAAGFEQAVAQVRGVYAAQQAADRFDADLFPGEHEVSGRRSFDWLADQLTTSSLDL